MAAEPSPVPASESKRVPLQAPASSHGNRAVQPDIEGQVLVDGREPGHPVGLRVRFHTQTSHEPTDTRVYPRGDVRRLVTDDAGRFEVFAVGAESTFSLQAPGLALEPDQPARWETPAREIVLRLRTAPVLRGRVVGPGGELVPGATGVHWLRGTASDWEILLDPAELLADREARFEIPLLGLLEDGPAGEWEGTLVLEVPHVGRRLLATGRLPLADNDLGEIRLEPVRVLRFRVRAAQGPPLGGAVARLDDHWLSKPSSPTNGEGYGELRYAPERTVRVRFSALGCEDQVLLVGVGEEPEAWLSPATVLEVQLEPPANSYGPFPGLVLSSQEELFERFDEGEQALVQGPNWIQTQLGATPAAAHGSRKDASGRYVYAHFQPDSGGRVRVVGLRPGVPLALEVRDSARTVLASSRLLLEPGETKRIALRYGE